LTNTTDVRADVPGTDVTSPDAQPAGEPASDGAAARARKRTGLTGMVLADLQRLAAELGVTGTARMRKGDLIAVIKEHQNGSQPAGAPVATAPAGSGGAAESPAESPAGSPAVASSAPAPAPATRTRGHRTAQRAAGAPSSDPAPVSDVVAASTDPDASAATPPAEAPGQPAGAAESGAGQTSTEQSSTRQNHARDGARRESSQRTGERANEQRDRGGQRGGDRSNSDRSNSDRSNNERGTNNRGQNDRGQNDRGQNDRGQNDRGQNDRTSDDDYGDGGRRRGRRFRDRRRGRERPGESEPVVAEDDVLVPVAGILDVLDNYAFVRTTGYLTGPNDVYVSLSQVRRYDLRRGDAISGAVREPREGERRDKYNALVRLDQVNGLDPEEAKKRPEFHKLTPLYPQDRLRLETEPHILTTRVIDLVAPIGKGQRALIVSPPKAGKTMVMQAIANAITTNNPECHLMVVLVDERPEEVTDMQRSVKGEVIASTFDRPPSDHTTVAELSIERAKRLVELGHDVVVLLDSITRLGRAYNNASPASGRILSGGIDSTALYPPKRFLGAARNIEDGGSLTILATALVQTGSTGDTVIYEEYKGTGNAELYLDRRLADKRIFPAVDVVASGTRKEEILLSPDELAIVIKLRRVLHALEPQQALELVLDRLRKTATNVEFLMQVQKTTSIGSD